MNAEEVLESWSDIEQESDDSDMSSEGEESDSESDGDNSDDSDAWREVTGRFGGCIPAENVFVKKETHESK